MRRRKRIWTGERPKWKQTNRNPQKPLVALSNNGHFRHHRLSSLRPITHMYHYSQRNIYPTLFSRYHGVMYMERRMIETKNMDTNLDSRAAHVIVQGVPDFLPVPSNSSEGRVPQNWPILQ